MTALLPRTRAVLLSCVLSACGKDEADDAGDTGSTTSFATTVVTHGGDPSGPVSQTFTNSGDPSGDPTTASSVSATSTTAGSSEGSSGGGGSSSGGPGDSSGVLEGSSGAGSSGAAETGDTGNPGGPCCDAQDAAGCGDDTIESCVCAGDDFCCTVQWDLFCTVQVVRLGCGECPGIGGDGDCCAAHGNPGCDDESVEQCVCEMDFVCCLQPWDDVCVQTASDSCGAAC
ncbi:MAG: hypothetical protein K1X88_22625 [Nannocystaceae bacterium]|nr:hypothetical protein [Nannocystaceae bacterium]